MNPLTPSSLQEMTSAERILKQALLHRALRCGPSVARLVENLWASSLLEADQDARQLMRLSNTHGRHRLEAACRRAIYYRQDKNTEVIRWILDRGLERLPLTPFTDIRGQFIFPLDQPEIESQDNVESKIMCEKDSD
jgi:hypothetical protein